MQPKRIIAARRPSPPARHKDFALTACEGELKIGIQPSAISLWDAIVVIRCASCDTAMLAQDAMARAVQVIPVIRSEDTPRATGSVWDDTEDDVEGWVG